MSRPLADRFREKVDRSGGPAACWPWLAYRDTRGYGRIEVGRRSVHAHRVALELALGVELRSDEYACHHCDNKICVNPAHLYVGTARTNRIDAVTRGQARYNPRRGEAHTQARLTTSQVLELRARYAAGGIRQDELAAEYGVSQGSISRAIRRECWAHV